MVSEALLGFSIAQATHLVSSLAPFTFKVRGDARRHQTDGHKLVRLARGAELDGFRERYAKLLRATLGQDLEVPGPPPSAPRFSTS